MKHTAISDTKKAKLRHPAEVAAEAKAKEVAAPAVEKPGGPKTPRGRSAGAGGGKGGRKGDEKGDKKGDN